MIKAPYNFVPLSDKVCYLEKEEANVQYDVPFADGLTGTIYYKAQAKTPMFLKDGENDGFSQYNGQYYIPSSSIKGSIRNVMEILSFSKMSRDFVEDFRFGYRDLNNQEYKDKLQDVLCGWMYKKANKIYIKSHIEYPYKIDAAEIDKMLSTGRKLSNFIRGKIEPYQRTARYKVVELLGNRTENRVFRFSSPNSQDVIKANPDGDIRGKIVLTGQSGSRDDRKHRGKRYEFVFPEYQGEDFTIIEVSSRVFCEFETIHAHSSDYVEWRKEQLEQGREIPVFFQLDDADENVTSIGLSYMYKYPYNNSVYDGLPQWRDERDITETIFGYTNQKSQFSLKGRVRFSHIKLSEAKCLKPVNLVLGGPRASYYPSYLKNGNNWNSNDVKIAGWKRYPVRNTIHPSNIPDGDEKRYKKVMTTIHPLSIDGFEGTIQFFNLRPFELGALLSALTFHGNGNCYHSIGMAKAFGYGAVRLSISKIEYADWQCEKDIVSKKSIEEYMHGFYSFVSERIGVDVKNSEQWKELMAMSSGIQSSEENKFTYMSLNEYRDAKRNNERLKKFTEIN